MHEEFALQYEKRWLERFGLTYYGCCEPSIFARGTWQPYLARKELETQLKIAKAHHLGDASGIWSCSIKDLPEERNECCSFSAPHSIMTNAWKKN
jgi:hypothetical protein